MDETDGWMRQMDRQTTWIVAVVSLSHIDGSGDLQASKKEKAIFMTGFTMGSNIRGPENSNSKAVFSDSDEM